MEEKLLKSYVLSLATPHMQSSLVLLMVLNIYLDTFWKGRYILVQI